MASHDLIVIVDQNGIVKTKALDASGDLLDLLGRMGAGISGVGGEGMSRPMLEVH
jgi:hypothetical protein